MFKKKLTQFSLIFILDIFLLHIVANTFYWYLTIPWFDMFMHTLGGIFLSLFCATIFSNKILKTSNTNIFLILFSFVFVVAFGWEVFEYIVQFFIKDSIQIANISDSISDMIFGFLGGILGFFFVLKQKKRYN